MMRLQNNVGSFAKPVRFGDKASLATALASEAAGQKPEELADVLLKIGGERAKQLAEEAAPKPWYKKLLSIFNTHSPSSVDPKLLGGPARGYYDSIHVPGGYLPENQLMKTLTSLEKLGLVKLNSIFSSRSSFRLQGVSFTEKGEALYEQHKA